MSDTKIFRHTDGSLAMTNHPNNIHSYRSKADWTEVQVVPLDAIVIRRAELPEVTVRLKEYRVNGHTFDMQTTEAEAAEYVLQAAALAEYLREHPQVDEEQVASLFEVLTEEWFPGDDGERASTLARRLVERGVRVEKS